MLNPNSQEESFSVQIPFEGSPKFKPNGNNILLDYKPETKAGDIYLPHQAKGLEFVMAKVIAKGPECKFVKEGDKVIVAQKALINEAKGGIKVGGVVAWFTQENLIISVVE